MPREPLPATYQGLPVVTAERMREVDRLSVEKRGLKVIDLMENAGRAVASETVVFLAAGGKVATMCGEQAKCGVCHLFVTEGRKGVSKMTALENSKLDSLIGVSGKSRLACQCELLGTENVSVELLGALSG